MEQWLERKIQIIIELFRTSSDDVVTQLAAITWLRQAGSGALEEHEEVDIHRVLVATDLRELAIEIISSVNLRAGPLTAFHMNCVKEAIWVLANLASGTDEEVALLLNDGDDTQ